MIMLTRSSERIFNPIRYAGIMEQYRASIVDTPQNSMLVISVEALSETENLLKDVALTKIKRIQR